MRLYRLIFQLVVLSVLDIALQLPCAIAFVRELQNAGENVVTKPRFTDASRRNVAARTGSAHKHPLNGLRCHSSRSFFWQGACAMRAIPVRLPFWAVDLQNTRFRQYIPLSKLERLAHKFADVPFAASPTRKANAHPCGPCVLRSTAETNSILRLREDDEAGKSLRISPQRWPIPVRICWAARCLPPSEEQHALKTGDRPKVAWFCHDDFA